MAGANLRAFLSEIAAQRGHALTEQAADALTSLTVRVAGLLEIPLAGIAQPR